MNIQQQANNQPRTHYLNLYVLLSYLPFTITGHSKIKGMILSSLVNRCVEPTSETRT